MAQPGFTTSESDFDVTESPLHADLSGKANLTPDEYMILFGDSAAAGSEEPLATVSPLRPAGSEASFEAEQAQATTANRAKQRLEKLLAHPYLSATVLLISVLIGAAIARGILR